MLFKSLLAAAFTGLASAQLSLLYQFPNTSYVNIENVAIRSSTGSLLLNIATGPSLVELDPSNPVPNYLITLSGPDSLTGIAETSKDVFTVAAGNFSFGPQTPGGVAGIQGTFGVWSIDLTSSPATARQIVAIPPAVTLNGLAQIPYTDYVLIADSGLGAIWRVNIHTGEAVPAITDPLFANSAEVGLGINGLKIRKGVVYFTNSAQGTYGSVPINKDGYATGPVTIIANAPIVDGPNSSFDDFSLDKKGNAYIATQPDSVSLVSLNGAVNPIAGPSTGQAPEIIAPTATALDKWKGLLYVVTGGSGNPQAPTSGQVFVGKVY